MEAIILAGGLGTRLRGVIGGIPKCMAPVNGKPFLQYQLEWLSRFDVRHVVFSVGYLKEQVIDFVKGREWPFAVSFAVEKEPLGTGGGIRLALQKCREKQVFVLNGDTFYNVDLSALSFTAPVTLALKPMRDFDRYGAVDWDGDLVTGFREKQYCAEGLINGGVYAIDRSQLDISLFPKTFSFEREVLEPLTDYGLVAGEVQDGYFIDIGIPEDYARAQRELPEIQAVLKASDAVLSSEADTLFLDRDGVINRWLPGDYVKSWDQFAFLPGIRECLRKWAGHFKHVVLVSNQRGVGKGMMTPEDLEKVHDRMLEEIRQAGGRIDAVYTCTELEEDHPMRKPQPGMFLEACRDFPDIAPERSLMLGDSESDRHFAANCGMSFVLMETAELAMDRAAT
jgi:histidinol-phosphate phosphatase family domain/HAD-superfamily hydrolase, subfamily IIIA